MNKRLLDSPNSTIKSYTGRSQRQSLGSRGTMDSCDSEWQKIQQRLKETKELYNDDKSNNIDFLEFEQYDENSSNHANLSQHVQDVEYQVEELKKRLNQMKERFIWDLSLAIKRKSVSKLKIDSKEAISISNISVQSILENSKIDEPSPHEWKRWIEKQFI